MEEFVVGRYSDYARVVRQLYGKYTENGSLIVLRGQTSEFRLPDGRLALVPSFFRSSRPTGPTGLREAVIQYLEDHLKTADELTRWLFENRFGSSLQTFLEAYEAPSPTSFVRHAAELTDLPAVYAAVSNHEFWSAVAQHYGLATGMLDVTTDPDVALWFAVHKYTSQDGERRVNYEPWDRSGYVYALRVIAEPTDIVPLSTFFFDQETRPRRQQGALLSRMYYVPSDEDLEELIKESPRWAFPERPVGNSLGEFVIARIVIEKPFPSRAADWPTEHLFPCPSDDRLYMRLLEKCEWVEKFGHCKDTARTTQQTDRQKQVASTYDLAQDPSWFTILFLGDDADAQIAYASRCIYTGSPLGKINLFERAGFNLIAVTAEETKRLILSHGVSAIRFCDVGQSLLQSGVINEICRLIARKRRVVVPVYTNLDEAERRYSVSPFEMLVETAEIEAEKVVKSIRSSIEWSWQLQRAHAGSTCHREFIDMLRNFFDRLTLLSRNRATRG